MKDALHLYDCRFFSGVGLRAAELSAKIRFDSFFYPGIPVRLGKMKFEREALRLVTNSSRFSGRILFWIFLFLVIVLLKPLNNNETKL